MEAPTSPIAMLTTFLPGPDRKRQPSAYHYRVTYRNSRPEPGCVMTWEVLGGRQVYQVALEETPSGSRRWHCSCADAIFRGDGNPRHVCKHIRGLMQCLPTMPAPSQAA